MGGRGIELWWPTYTRDETGRDESDRLGVAHQPRPDESVADDPRLVVEDGLPAQPATHPALFADDLVTGSDASVVEQLGEMMRSASRGGSMV
jgi:hypothetical protein